jgi:hypothetical protein
VAFFTTTVTNGTKESTKTILRLAQTIFVILCGLCVLGERDGESVQFISQSENTQTPGLTG